MHIPQLVLFDADHIKEYVFTTGRLKELRGASEQVRRLTDFGARHKASIFDEFDLKVWQPGADEGVIYASGGAGAVLFPNEEQAAAFCTALEQAFRWQTAAATLSAVWTAVNYAGAVRREDAEAAAQLQAAQKLARRKASRPQAELIPGGGPLRFCASDRLRPASVRIQEADNESLFASEATANKRFNNRNYRTRAAVIKAPFWQAFEGCLASSEQSFDSNWHEAIHASQDLGTLAAQSRPTGYVALVYVDGDRIGQTLRSVVERDGFRGYFQLSQALAYATTQATAEALAAAYGSHAPGLQPDPDRPRQAKRFLPFEVITIGGDDVILVCTAEHGLAVAQQICDRFGPLVADYLGRQPDPISLPKLLSASAGVVIAHDSLPIVQLERRGRELLRSAKRCEGGGIDFHIVSTPALAEIKTVRNESYRFEATGLTSRPYSHANFDALLKAARRLQALDIPGSKRADLYNACFAERIQATLNLLTVQTRLRQREREALLRILIELGYGLPYPFREDSDRKPPYHTSLIDLLEMMEFIAEEEQWGRASARK